MVDAVTVGRAVAGVGLLLANGYFVTTEFAMTRVRQFPESAFTGHPGLERAWAMTERLEIFLSGCQVGITVSSVGLGVVAEPAVTALLDPLFRSLGFSAGPEGHTAVSVAAAFGLINFLHVVIGEQAPTYLGVERSRFVAKHGSRPLYYWTKLMWPVIYFADKVSKRLLSLFGVTISRSWAEEEDGETEPSTRGEVRSMMGETLSRLGLSTERRQEVISALEIDRVTAGDVMVPPDEVVALSVAEPLEVNVERMNEAPHVRFPLVGERGLEEFRGIVYTPTVLSRLDDLREGTVTLSELATDPMTVPVDAAISDVIDRFQAESQELALVTDGQEVVGLVTVTDAMEVITGEVRDPLDESE